MLLNITEKGRAMLEYIQQGGVIMIPILFCSVLALGIIVERFWNLRRSRIIGMISSIALRPCSGNKRFPKQLRFANVTSPL